MEVDCGGIYLYEPPTYSSTGNLPVFVASGHEQLGLRPYIIVSQDAIHRNRTTAVAVPLTTKLRKASAFRILLPASELINDPKCDPFVDSVALCDHVRVIDLNRIRKRLGKLSDNARLSVGLGLAFVFDFQ